MTAPDADGSVTFRFDEDGTPDLYTGLCAAAEGIGIVEPCGWRIRREVDEAPMSAGRTMTRTWISHITYTLILNFDRMPAGHWQRWLSLINGEQLHVSSEPFDVTAEARGRFAGVDILLDVRIPRL